MKSIPILMYHQIGEPSPRGTPYRGLTVHPGSFRRQMAWMRRIGYRGLSMRDLMPYLRGVKSGKVFGVTFDDGYRNVLENAAPILQACGFTATNYFVAGRIDGYNEWDRKHGIPQSKLMNADEIRRWHALGNEVGSHTLDHVHLPHTTPEEAARQVSQSKTILETLIDAPVTAFCYPYGDHGPEHIRMVHQAGYDNATLTVRGRASPADDPLALPRVTIARSTHLLHFLRKTLTGYEDRHR